MAETQAAKQLLMRDREASERQFEALLRDQAADGIVFFKRGEA
jgi:hypothetical protein